MSLLKYNPVLTSMYYTSTVTYEASNPDAPELNNYGDIVQVEFTCIVDKEFVIKINSSSMTYEVFNVVFEKLDFIVNRLNSHESIEKIYDVERALRAELCFEYLNVDGESRYIEVTKHKTHCVIIIGNMRLLLKQFVEMKDAFDNFVELATYLELK